MRDCFQRLGHEIQSQCPPDFRSALLYAEVEDGVVSAGVFFSPAVDCLVFRYATESLEDLVYEFWERGQGEVSAKSWRAMELSLHGSRLDFAFAFAEQFNDHDGPHERRRAVLARRYPGFAIDFSNRGLGTS